MNSKSQSFIQEVFSKYYRMRYVPRGVSEIDKREFGFSLFEGFMLRHKKFSNYEELKDFLAESPPKDAYYSCAYYEEPEADMDKKGWLGADLIFDIDADHIPAECEKIHDEWRCGNCNFVGKGLTPEKCPLCGSEKISAITWPCEKCLDSAKNETLKLLEILMDDFGFSKDEIKVFFSGHRGYHVQIESEIIKELNAFERKEIVDYITGLGFEPSTLQINGYKVNLEASSTPWAHGWRKRLQEGLLDFLKEADERKLARIGLKRNFAERIIQNKEKLIENLKSGRWSGIKGIGPQTFMKLMNYVIKARSAKIDSVVTTDTHRLIRLPESLNSKTGFRKTELHPKDLEKFDPFKSAIAFDDESRVVLFVQDAPKFRIKDEEFGPYKNKKIEVPMQAAVLLVCKNKAEVLQYNV
ncbi:DNA primase small subunit PriS [Candidatus Bathyarchaeota archaeon]|nr:DNA primase small subunit PriS [Candidatus Bathyarchaeota archaeon]